MPYSYNRIWIYAIWLTKERLPLINSSAEIIEQIKGSSLHYIKQQSNLIDKFAWQTSYAAYSLSESVVDKVYDTFSIKNSIIKSTRFRPSTSNLSNSELLTHV